MAFTLLPGPERRETMGIMPLLAISIVVGLLLGIFLILTFPTGLNGS
jgi:hypothetical protein